MDWVLTHANISAKYNCGSATEFYRLKSYGYNSRKQLKTLVQENAD